MLWPAWRFLEYRKEIGPLSNIFMYVFYHKGLIPAPIRKGISLGNSNTIVNLTQILTDAEKKSKIKRFKT